MVYAILTCDAILCGGSLLEPVINANCPILTRYGQRSGGLFHMGCEVSAPQQTDPLPKRNSHLNASLYVRKHMRNIPVYENLCVADYVRCAL